MEDNVSQVKSKNYREDILYQLKLEIDTSLDTLGRVTFTKNILNLNNYKGRPLEMYPFFAPYKIYRKGKIQRMTYLERVELFFNRQRFEQVIFGKKSRTRRKQKKRANIERNEEFEILKEKNFIFTMKMLFSTAFPIVDNFARSSDYFRSDFISNFTLKGTNLEFLPFLSGKFDKKFSHLKFNNEIYTVTKVIWVNDIFNHPLYNRIIDNFRKIKDDISALDKRVEGVQNLKRYLVKLFFGVPIEEKETEEKDQNDNMKNKIEKSGNWIDIIERLNNTKENINKETRKGAEMIRLVDVIERLDKNLTNETYGVLTKDSQNPKKKYVFNNQNKAKVQNKDDQFINNFFIQIENNFKEELEYLLNTNLISLGQENQEFLLEITRIYDQIFINTRAINYIKNFEFRFTREKKEYQEKIQQRIEEIFPRAKEFSDQLTEFAKGRTIGNAKWSKLVQSRQLSSEVKENFDNLAKCYTNENCEIDEKASQYIEVELDEITKRPEDAKVEMYEAFLQINIIEGEVTNKNYNKIKCTYLNEELDNFLDNFINPQDDWNIQNEKNFFSVKEVVAKANEELALEKSKKNLSRKENVKPVRKTKKKQTKQK